MTVVPTGVVASCRVVPLPVEGETTSVEGLSSVPPMSVPAATLLKPLVLTNPPGVSSPT